MLDDASSALSDPQDAAREAGLRYVSDARPGLIRRRAGKGFCYLAQNGARLRDAATLRRIRALAIPPAWSEVWICPFANGHIQASGRDARGRKQYRYHADFRAARESAKFDHMMVFAKALPAVRARVAQDMGRPGLPREKVLAAVVRLLETTLIRVGNEDYARANRSYGLTTLKTRHVEVEGAEVRFRFAGKSGRRWSLSIRDRRVAKIVKACQELPGQALLQYLDENGAEREIDSGDVNAYLREASGEDVTAKDFRTFAGTMLAALELKQAPEFSSAAEAKRVLRGVIERVAAKLGNTPTICRKCYIHPEVFNIYLDGALVPRIAGEDEAEDGPELAGLAPQEAAVLAMLSARLATGGRSAAAA